MKRDKAGAKIMRKHIPLIGLGLALSVMIGMAFVTANMSNVVEADVWIWPQRLTIDLSEHYLNSGLGEWVVAFIALPRNYSANDVDLPSITLRANGGSVPVSKTHVVWRRFLIAQFDRAEVIDMIISLIGHMTPNPVQKVTLTVMGNLYDGNVFRGEDTITVFFINP